MSNTLTKLCICIGLICILIGSFAYVQVLLTHNAADLAAALQTIKNREAVDGEYQVVNTLLEDTAQERVRLASYIIDGDSGTIAFLTTLEARAQARGVALVSTQLASQSGTKFAYDGLEVSVSFMGTQSAVQQFLTDVENLPFALYITTLSTQRRTSNGGSIEVSGSLTLVVSAVNIDV